MPKVTSKTPSHLPKINPASNPIGIPKPPAITQIIINRVNNTTRCDEDAGPGSDDLGPNVGTRIFEITSGGTLVDSNAVGGTKRWNSSSSNSGGWGFGILEPTRK